VRHVEESQAWSKREGIPVTTECESSLHDNESEPVGSMDWTGAVALPDRTPTARRRISAYRAPMPHTPQMIESKLRTFMSQHRDETVGQLAAELVDLAMIAREQGEQIRSLQKKVAQLEAR
jgi:hypothetical protein